MTYPKVNSFFLACFQLQLRWYNTLRVVCVCMCARTVKEVTQTNAIHRMKHCYRYNNTYLVDMYASAMCIMHKMLSNVHAMPIENFERPRSI